MKNLINSKSWGLILILIALPFSSAFADGDDFLLSVRNVTQSDTRTIEFDLYLQDADNTQSFEFAALQFGLLLNSSIYGGGTISVSYNNAGSGLDAEQQFVNVPDIVTSLTGYPGKTLIRLMPNSIPPVPPGAGSGTVISPTGFGTLLAHFIIENSVDFTANTRAGLEFCSGTSVAPLFPTILYSYINGDSAPLPVTPGADAIVDGDPLLNPRLPAIFNVTGGDPYCIASGGSLTGLSGSEADATYTIYRNGFPVGTINGTGSALSFGLQPASTLTVWATNIAGTLQMNGVVVITTIPLNTITLTSGAGSNNQNACVNSAITNITYSTTGATGADFSGLPTGVSGTWVSGVVTISGTPTATGTSNYTVALTGGCGTVSTAGTITVSAVNTVSPASTTPTLCINTALTAITHTTTGATEIGTPAGLPTGVTTSFSGGVITISGTPSEAGTFNYSIPLSGGCGTVSATGTITVTAAMTAGIASSTPTLCINTALTAITHNTTGATGIGTPTGLPTGVTTSFSGGVITISGTPSEAGTFNYSIPLSGGCGTVSATGTITVTAAMTAGIASSTPTLCINTPLTAITHTTTGATGIGTATGLPGGVTASWASNTITVSGTPTASGIFTYSIPLTGGCGSVNATGTITVTAANTITLTSGLGTNSQTVCSGTAITNITYSTTGATDATVTNLPAGVTGNWSSGVVNISGTPLAAGTFNYTVTLAGGCGSVTANGSINVNALPVTSAITGNTTPACSGTGVAYSVTSTAGSTYTWTVPTGATVASGQGTNSITVNFGTSNGNVAVTERNAAGCNGAPRTLAVSLQGCGLSADFSATPRSVCVGSTVVFTNLSTGTSAGTTYNWSFGSGANPLTTTGPGPHSVTYSTTGSKDVSLTITEGASDIETRLGYITVNPSNTITLTSAVGTNNQTVCVNTAITTITYITTGATGATFSGLPEGINLGWSANVVTISGVPSTSGTYNYTVTLTGGCGNVSTNGSINVSATNTASAGSSTPTVCINTALTPITHTTTGAIGIGTPTGLPAGVTAAWAANTITISGTPSVAGTYNYIIPLTGGCGSVNATGTINVIALPGPAGSISGPAAYTPGTSGVIYSVSPVTAATGYIWSYSGSGVTINGTGNSVTLDFSVSATSGTLSVFGRNSCGDGTISNLQLLPSTKILTLTSVLLEGLYDGAGMMRQAMGDSGPQWPAGIADHITVELHNPTTYSTVVFLATDVELSTIGSANITIPSQYSGSYYITIKHRNHIETVSAVPVSFVNATIGYSFDDQASAYGSNLKEIVPGSGYFAIYGGDINHDGYVDSGDYPDVINDSFNYLSGYLNTDLNGDGWIDSGDYPILVNNNYNYVSVIIPY